MRKNNLFTLRTNINRRGKAMICGNWSLEEEISYEGEIPNREIWE